MNLLKNHNKDWMENCRKFIWNKKAVMTAFCSTLHMQQDYIKYTKWPDEFQSFIELDEYTPYPRLVTGKKALNHLDNLKY